MTQVMITHWTHGPPHQRLFLEVVICNKVLQAPCGRAGADLENELFTHLENLLDSHKEGEKGGRWYHQERTGH